MNQGSIAVVYLMWLPYGLDYFQRFLKSYCSHIPSTSHRLVLLFNGVQHESECADHLALAKQQLKDFDLIILAKGQDIDAYFYAARNRTEERIIFLNTF